MLSIIKLMDEKLANMIAAGEVVERPSSVVKELVENAIDANASKIDIHIKESGLHEIKVVDNGIGMDKIDAKTAFLRHATSKISTEYDLERIKTLGFRGEALAAILSVSKITLKTRQKGNEAFFYEYVDSKLVKEGTCALNTGTEIVVNDLFYNTPARLKYIKSEYSERASIIDTFDRIALSHPKISFSLTIDEKLIKETFGNDDYFSLLNQIYGSSVLRDLIVFENEFQKIKVKGYLGSPSLSRARKKDISIFVNGRYIKNYGLTQSIIDGYHSFLMVNRYPLAIIMLEMDPYLLDVNVHPQKLEVKFANESLIKYHLEMFIKNELVGNSHEIPTNLSNNKKDYTINNNQRDVYVKEELEFNYDTPFNSEIIKEEIINDYEIKPSKIPDFSYIGTLAGTYLLFQNEQGLYMVDQHAAEERINYEYYYEKLGSRKIIVKEMIIPRELHLTKEDLAKINDYSSAFKEKGFIFNDKMQLLGHPNFILNEDLEEILNQMVLLIEEKNLIDYRIIMDQIAKNRSCKASIKANHQLSRKEIDTLIARLKQTKNPYTCPHGRPTIIHLTFYDIEKMFKRVV